MENNGGSLVGSSGDPNQKDPYTILKIRRNPDGSLTRYGHFPNSKPDSSPSSPVLSKDLTLNPTSNTWIRIFLPNNSSLDSTQTQTRTHLPIVVYLHGGGFILFSAASTPFHDSCASLALHIPAIIVAVEYRLAPEHPLPAAYDDAIDALRWVRESAPLDPWFASADFSRCFLMGSSAGGNIVLHAVLRSADENFNLAGLIINQPYFGGNDRTESELRLAHDRILPLAANDLMWQLSLPAGSDRDHEFCNPNSIRAQLGPGMLPRCLVTGHGQDPLVDRQRAFVRLLEEIGVPVVSHFDDDGFHGVELFNQAKAQEFADHVKKFVWATNASQL